MAEDIRRSPERPTLFYKNTCPPCQWMSRLVVIYSLGVIRRVALTSAEARELYRQFPDHAGQLVLIEQGRITFGRMVFAMVPRAVLLTWWWLLAGAIRRTRTAASITADAGTTDE